MNIPFKNLIAVKPKSSYPKKIQEEFGLISVNKNESMPIGTYSYRYSRFPSDIDLYESVSGCCNVDDVVNKFERAIKKITLDVISKPLHYFMEVKCGIDERYKLDIGKLQNGQFIVNPNLRAQLMSLYQQNLLSKDEYDEMIEILDRPNLGQLEYEIIDEMLRKYYVIRWTAHEILQGMKVLPGNKPILLNDAIRQKSQINIEIISFIGNRFIDESNFFVLAVAKPDGSLSMINLPQDYVTKFPEFFIEGLKKSIAKLYYSKINANPFKMLKRYWSLAKFLKDENMIRKIYPFLSSDVASINQIKSDFGTLAKLLKRSKNVPMNLVTNELSNMKDRVANIMLFSNEFIKEFNESIEKLINKFNSSGQNVNELINDLHEMEDLFFDIVEKHTIEFLNRVGLSTPPKNYLPSEPIF